MTLIVDTNVILVANRQHNDVGEACAVECEKRLRDIMASGRIAIDDRYRILKEYQNKTRPQTGKRAGDAFLKWLLRNNANPSRCDQVALVAHPDRDFVSFPDDPRLADFDRSDRKFIAVSAAHPDKPGILQAADSKWLRWAPALEQHAITIEFLCPMVIRTFHTRKNKQRRRKG